MYDVIIIGSGPAGMTAAIYLLRNNAKVAIFEKEMPGGRVATTALVENYPGFQSISGVDLSLKMYEQVIALKAAYFTERVTGITPENNLFKVRTSQGEYLAKAVIIATGMTYRELGVPGEAKYLGRGISRCAICDGSFYKGQEVAVIGGGNSALEESLYLTNIVDHVYIIQNLAHFTGDKNLADRVLAHDKITVYFETTVNEFLGDAKGLTGLKLSNGETLHVPGAFEYIGFVADAELYEHLGIADQRGFIPVDSNQQSRHTGIYAVGDVVSKHVRQIVTAEGDGAIAALAIVREYLS